jgi:hypothetical protein
MSGLSEACIRNMLTEDYFGAILHTHRLQAEEESCAEGLKEGGICGMSKISRRPGKAPFSASRALSQTFPNP